MPRGVGVDAAGGPTVDPTENVKDLSEAANKRQDDLRNGLENLVKLQVAHIRDMLNLQIANAKELAILRAEHAKEISDKESDRINAIRAVDVAAVSTAAQKAADQATVLANQLVTTAETLRSLVATTAAQQAETLQQTVSGLSSRLASLEQLGAQSRGEKSLSDPALVQLLAKVDSLGATRSEKTGATDNTKTIWSIGIAVVGAVGVLIAVLNYLGKAAPSVAPAVSIPPGFVLAPAPK